MVRKMILETRFGGSGSRHFQVLLKIDAPLVTHLSFALAGCNQAGAQLCAPPH